MDDVLLGKVAQSEIYVADDLPAVWLFQSAARAHNLGLEITFVANLSNDVAVVGAADDVMALQDVRMPQRTQNFDF